jgi:hypothetical protein
MNKTYSEYLRDYRKGKYDELRILTPKGTKERIRKTGKTINAFVNELVLKELDELEKKDAK